jgi:ABC-2 type transport system permease protein
MKYSQVQAMLAITRASLRSITRSPSAVVFSFVFPFIFIIVFGFIGGGSGMQSYNIVMAKDADTTNALYTALKSIPTLKFKQFETEEALKKAQQKGRVAGVINIIKNKDSAIPFSVKMFTTNSSDDQWPQLQSIINATINKVSDNIYKGRLAIADFKFDAGNKNDRAEIRQYKTIDFILPGQLGFSLLSAGVFGVAFSFFNLRNQLILKRFFATPISRTHIILGECLSRVIFQMITAIVIIAVGNLFFGFTLVNGPQTFFEMLFLSFIGLIVFMGFGFIVSGLAKSDSTIPPFANLITLPQFLLGGTFFAIDNFPKWLQPISKALPLTHLNTAMRAVAFEGQSLWDIKGEIGILLLWAVIVYAVAIKVFKWES